MDSSQLAAVLNQVLDATRSLAERIGSLEQRMNETGQHFPLVATVAETTSTTTTQNDGETKQESTTQNSATRQEVKTATPPPSFLPPLGGLIEEDEEDHYFGRRPPPGPRTIRRQSSTFAPASESNTLATPATSALHVSVPRFTVDPNTMLQKCTVPGILYAIDLHRDYLTRQPEAKIPVFRKGLAEFCSKAVLEEIFNKEKSLSTLLSTQLDRYQDLISVSDNHFIEACARLLRPKGQKEFFDVLKKVGSKHSLPKIVEWRITEDEYAFKIPRYEEVMFKQMDALIRFAVDTVEFVYLDAKEADLRRLPPSGWGTKDKPGVLRLMFSVFNPYTNSLVQALGGQKYLDTNASNTTEFREILNLWNQKQASLSIKLQDQDAELLPVKTVKELEKEFALESERKKAYRKVAETPRAHIIQESQEERVLSTTDLDYSSHYTDDEDLDASNIMYATPQSHHTPKPQSGVAKVRECTCTNVCHNVLYRNRCDLGKDCIYEHGSAAILQEVETYLRQLVSSPSVGEQMVQEVLAKIKRNPGPPAPEVKPVPIVGNTSLRTPLNPSRFVNNAGRGGGRLYNPGGRGFAGRGDVRLLDASDSSEADLSAEGLHASEGAEHQA